MGRRAVSRELVRALHVCGAMARRGIGLRAVEFVRPVARDQVSHDGFAPSAAVAAHVDVWTADRARA